MIKIKHSGNLGDIIYSLNAMQSAAELHNDKILLMIDINKPINLHPSFIHPLGGVMMNEYMFKMAKPFLKSFDFIEDVMVYKGSNINYDFDRFRGINFNLAAGNIKRWYLYAYPELQMYFSDKSVANWVNEDSNYIVLNRTQRYNNPFIDYSILKSCTRPIYFVGTYEEYILMKESAPNVKFKECKNFLELALFISKSTLFIGNQSMCFAIAEQIGANALLELSPQCPNVIPTTALEMYNQNGFEFALKNYRLI